MPIEKVTASQFAEELQLGILDRDRTWDVYVGEIPDLCVGPHARVFERQNDRTRKLSLMMTLSNPDEFEEEYEIDLEGIVYNEGMTRSQGSQATATGVFSRSSPPTTDLRVQRGYPVATLPDEGTGQTITYVATEETTMPAASASSYFNIATQRYELSVPLIAVIEGSDGRVGPRRITRPLRPLLGFDSVTNPVAASGGRDRETNADLIDRYLIAITGRRISTNDGAKKVVEDDFPAVEDSLMVGGTNPLLTRAADTAGAVDAYIIGAETIEVTENPPFLGAGQLIQLLLPPVVEVLSVQDLSTGAAPLVLDTDYEIVTDSSDLNKSSRAVEGIRFLFTSGSLPTIGNPVTITYTYNNLIRRLQIEFELDDKKSEGRDLLFKEGTEVPIALTANLRVLSGYNTDTVRSAVDTAILSFVNGSLKLGDDVEESDIQGVVRQISGVDNFIFTRLSRLSITSGVGDIAIASNEYPTLDSGDLNVALI